MLAVESHDTRPTCSRAINVVRSIRERLSGNAYREHQRNFTPYDRKRKMPLSAISTTKRKKAVSWSTKFVCLASKNCCQVPGSVSEKEVLVDAGLGEKKVDIPDIDCTAEEFHKILTEAFPKLSGAGGFELLRCVANSRLLEPLSTSVSSNPKLMKAVIGKSRIYIRPIQKDLNLDLENDSPISAQVGLYVCV